MVELRRIELLSEIAESTTSTSLVYSLEFEIEQANKQTNSISRLVKFILFPNQEKNIAYFNEPLTLLVGKEVIEAFRV